MPTHHTQCLLTRTSKSARWRVAVQTSWIPSKLAVKGKFLKIKNLVTGRWSDGWKVAEVYAVHLTEAVEDRSQDYKRTRKASDI